MRKSIFAFIISLGAASVLFAGSCGRSEEGAPGKAGEESAFTDPLGFKPSGYEHKPVKLNTRAPGYHGHPYVRDLGNLREVFLDSNKYQYAWAERIGINQIHSLRDAYRTGRPLVKITDCEAYGLDRLTHSVPFLVPEAAELLERIGYDFRTPWPIAAYPAIKSRLRVCSELPLRSKR